MIVKDRNPSEHPVAKAPTAVAGEVAEKQLAFYLSRAFADTPAIAIFNDLRIVDAVGGGDVAQIDHLVLHPCGFVLVESKSITGSVRINKQREWVRVSSRGEEGMPDAVEQARRQRDVLRRHLDRHLKNLLRPGRTFAALGFDVLAAVSDQGVIEREIPMPKVVKADQVPAKIKAIATQRLELAKDDATPNGKLTELEFAQITEFLLRSHTPLRQSPPRRPTADRASPKRPAAANPRSPRPSAKGVSVDTPRPPEPPPAQRLPAAPASPVHHCPQCNGTRIEMRWGTRPKGYYFHCLTCEKNWRPDRSAQTCPACRRPDVPLRKSQDLMLLACPVCGHAGVFHRNG